MKTKITFICVACFLLGFLIGVGGSIRFVVPLYRKEVALASAVVKDSEVSDSEHRAFEAYQHETPAVAIYALNRYLDVLRQAELRVSRDSVLITTQSISADLMFTHARLARVYAEAGQPDASAQHAGEALRIASKSPDFEFITNRATLSEILSRVDTGASK